MKNVPNVFPTQSPGAHRLAIIGEAPGRDEDLAGKPFCGYSGRFLRDMLSRAGLSADKCFIGNVCQIRPPNNDISYFAWDGPEIQEGLAQLTVDLRAFNPHCCLLLGNYSLRAAKSPTILTKRLPFPISDWRASMFQADDPNSPMFGRKCMGTYHPAYVLRDYSVNQVFFLDLKRAVIQATTPLLALPKRNIIVPSSVQECLDLMANLPLSPVAIDIEGYVDNMTMVGFATSASDAFVVPFAGPGGSYWNEEDEPFVWRQLAKTLANPAIPKILQNSLYDRFVLQYGYAIPVRGVADDIMLKHWELFCELEKSLAFQTSIYTYEPYYKSDRKSDSWTTKYLYCGKDCCVTKECNEVEDRLLSDVERRRHYNLNLSLLEPVLYMELRGLAYDINGATKSRADCLRWFWEAKYKLDQLCSTGVGHLLPEQRKALIREKMVYKNGKGVRADFVAVHDRALALVDATDTSQVAELSVLCKTDMNVGSPMFTKYIYFTLKLPLQTGDDDQPTANYEALLNIYKKTKHPVVELAMQIRELATRVRTLEMKTDPDGRVRCGYNVVGETGRVLSYTSPTGSGDNLNTLPKKNTLRPKEHPLRLGMRHLIRADPEMTMFKCDLAGADSWTVACWCAFLGDNTLLDDLLAGIKPAKVLLLLIRKGQIVNQTPRDVLKQWCDEISGDDPDYFMTKIGNHGSFYLMGARKLSRQIFVQSEGLIIRSETEVENVQRLLFTRYWGGKQWHQYCQRQISKQIIPELKTSSGHVRRFYGRKQEILGEWLAEEPQHNTTWATNMALMKLWNDPENHRPDGSLYIEPLKHDHDAFSGQFPTDRLEWAKERIRGYFNNPITIAGRTITIPFDGSYGQAWEGMEEGHI